MRSMEQRPGRSLIGPVRLDADETVLHQVGAAHAVFARQAVQRLEDLNRPDLLAVDRCRNARFEGYGNFGFLVRGAARGGGNLPSVFGRLAELGLEHAPLVAQVPDVLIAAVRILPGRWDGDVVPPRVPHGVLARLDICFAPGTDAAEG